MDRLQRLLGRHWLERIVLAVAALLFLVGSAYVRFVEPETSSVVEITVAPPSTSASAPSAAPKKPEPTPTSATAVATTSTTTKTTTTRASGSDTLVLGLLGFGVFLGLVSALFNRLSEISGPGGIGIKLTAEQKAGAARAVGRKVAERAAVDQPAPQFAALPVVQLAQMAMAAQARTANEVRQPVAQTATQAAEASDRATALAETLLRLASDPEGLRTVAASWGIPSAEWTPILAGQISDALWARLADRAIDGL